MLILIQQFSSIRLSIAEDYVAIILWTFDLTSTPLHTRTWACLVVMVSCITSLSSSIENVGTSADLEWDKWRGCTEPKFTIDGSVPGYYCGSDSRS